MSWSLQLRNGDLFHHEGQYAQVQGPAKLLQDLRCQLLERLGNDDLHPGFGSNLDSVINTMDFNQATLDIESEIRRIEQEYQNRQLSRIQDDVRIYGRTTLRRDEILESISDIDFQQVGDTIFVKIVVKPASGIPEIIQLPVATL